MTGRDRQSEIFVGGASGQRIAISANLTQLEADAQQIMTEEAFAYVAGGAGTEATMRANRAAFDRWRIVPRVLRDVSTRDTSVRLFGQTLPSPFLLAPIGVLEMAHPAADRAVAEAAAAEGIPLIFSSQASVPMETAASVMGEAPRWFQLYWSTHNDLVESFVQRAEQCGCSAIVVTLDTTLLGWRPRDLDLAYLPFLRGKGIAQYTSDPVFQRLLDADPPPEPDERTVNAAALKTLVAMTKAYPGGFLDTLRSQRGVAAVRQFIRIYSRPSLTWADLAFLRERTTLPILLKGILHADDASRALDHGINGVMVSNHGGRQVDGALAALDALPSIVNAIDGRVPVLMDSGIRSGADSFKALALGATAVCLGRPYVYGLALGGISGVRHVLRHLKADFDLTMGLSGCRSVEEIRGATLVQA